MPVECGPGGDVVVSAGIKGIFWKLKMCDVLEHLLVLFSLILVFPMAMSQDLFLPEWISPPILVNLA